MPMGKGTYGKKRGRPKKNGAKKLMAKNPNVPGETCFECGDK